MIDEEAKAAQEIAKATGKGIDAVQRLGGFLDQVFGASLKEWGGSIHDRIKVYRFKNMLRLQDKVEAIYRQRLLEGKTTPLPLRSALPLLEKAALEDDEAILSLWAALIANASDPQKRLNVRKIYIDIISSLEPVDAAVLQHLRTSQLTMIELLNAMKVSSEELYISAQNLARLGCIRQEFVETWDQMNKSGFDVSNVSSLLVLTDLGWTLLEACQVDNATGTSR